MNQILNYKENNLDTQKNSLIEKKIKFRFGSILFLCIIILIVIVIYIFYKNYQIIQKNNLSQKMANSFEISKLYSYNTTNSSSILKYSENDGNFNIIGIIKIENLNLNYPILSNYSNDLLKISPCRISGPFPNQEGNLCIAAHNYNNSTYFSNIDSLKLNDKITIYNSSGDYVDYFVYQNYETNASDLSCMNSTPHKEITLITCNNLNPTKRIIIKAKERL